MIKFAKTKSGEIIHINSAEKHTDYYIDDFTYIAKKGDIKSHHFALKKSTGITNFGHFSCNESLEHYNWKMHIALTQYVKFNNASIVAFKTKTEVKIENRIIDVVFYDKNSNIICLIEVVKTNDLSGNKIEDLKNYTIIRYEINNNKPRITIVPSRGEKSRAIDVGTKIEKLIERITKGRNELHKLNKNIESTNKKVREKESADNGSKYSIFKTFLSLFVEKSKAIEDAIARAKSEIEYRKSELQEYRDGIQTIPDLKRKIRILEK